MVLRPRLPDGRPSTVCEGADVPYATGVTPPNPSATLPPTPSFYDATNSMSMPLAPSDPPFGDLDPL
jgi:hypothetical protein